MRRCLALFAIPLAACATDTPERRGPVVRDSAGIRIVENTAPLWQEGEEWRLSEEPVVDIGGEDTEEEQLFQVAGALRLPDGRIVIANRGSHELRFYGREGAHLRSVGGQGAGPGEFQGLRWIGQHNHDPLYTFDARQRRISVFGRSGQFVRSINLRPTETIAFPGFVGLFQNGDILATGSPPGPPLTNVRSGIVAPDHYLVRYEPDGATARILTSVPSDQMFHLVEENGRIIAAPLLFGRSTQIFPWIDRILVATNDQYEIKVYDADGGLVLVIRRTVDDVAVSDADIEASIQGNLNSEETDFGRRLLNRLFGAMPIPETFPAFSSVHLDELGQLWVQDYNRPGDDRNRWAVLDAEGQWLGMVDLPGSFSPLDIGSDYVLGLWRDADDVEHVRMYELVKPERR